MKLKKGVTINKLEQVLLNELQRTERILKVLEGKAYEITITSANDGIHKRGSKHYENKAIDIRTRDMIYTTLNTQLIRAQLGKEYDVILESDHIHIEYDPK